MIESTPENAVPCCDGNRSQQAIHVTRAIIPDPVEYAECISRILSSRHLTNMGEHTARLEQELCKFLDIPFLALCTNGTLALQLSLRAGGLVGREIITTPFSYVASVSAVLWEGCTPIFADIDEETLCLDPGNLENLCSDATGAILPVHVYGNACDVEAIEKIAARNNLTTLYDAAQAFGTLYKGKSLLSYGDFSTVSFHATKVFHTVEGGGIVSRTQASYDYLALLRAFGHTNDTHHTLGINAKLTEPHAAMGLCLLDKVTQNIADRKKISQLYDSFFPSHGVRKPRLHSDITYNYAYYPVIFDDTNAMQRALVSMNQENIFPRRYFYPALNTLPYLTSRTHCPVAESICTRVLSLPLYADLEEGIVERIMQIVKKSVK